MDRDINAAAYKPTNLAVRIISDESKQKEADEPVSGKMNVHLPPIIRQVCEPVNKSSLLLVTELSLRSMGF